MTRRPKCKETQRTNPDHRPMIPEFRSPEDSMDAAIREIRRRFDEINPGAYLKWR